MVRWCWFAGASNPRRCARCLTAIVLRVSDGTARYVCPGCVQ